MRNADWNFKESAHERQWSIGVVTPIINDVVECYMESAMIMNLFVPCALTVLQEIDSVQ